MWGLAISIDVGGRKVIGRGILDERLGKMFENSGMLTSAAMFWNIGRTEGKVERCCHRCIRAWTSLVDCHSSNLDSQ
jgi:hypothetical protein